MLFYITFAEVHHEQLFGLILCAVATYVFARFSLGGGWESQEKLCEVRILSHFYLCRSFKPSDRCCNKLLSLAVGAGASFL